MLGAGFSTRLHRIERGRLRKLSPRLIEME
jgi:hypothetical protein